MRDLGYEKKPVLAIDAKATENILHRQGIGKLKHIDVAYLWIQDEVRSQRLKVRRVRSEDNIADLGTKPLGECSDGQSFVGRSGDISSADSR